MAWTGIDIQKNPYAPGGSLYDQYRQGNAGYGQNPSPNIASGLMTGTEWWRENPYAPGGIHYGQQPGYTAAGQNPISQQLAASYQQQKAAELQRAGQGGPSPGSNPLGGALGQLLGQIGTGLGGGINYSSGITAGPVYSPQQTAAAQQGIGSYGQQQAAQPLAAPGTPAGMQSALARQLQDATRAGTTQAQTQFGRDAAFKNAQQDLASQTARAQSGVGLANLGLQLQQSQMQPLMQLLQMFGGLI